LPGKKLWPFKFASGKSLMSSGRTTTTTESSPKRYAVIDQEALAALCGFTDLRDFQRAHRQWVEQALENGCAPRDDRWSEAIAVGSLPFVENVKSELGLKAVHRAVSRQAGHRYCGNGVKLTRANTPAKMTC
jgi:hypothetical protein